MSREKTIELFWNRAALTDKRVSNYAQLAPEMKAAVRLCFQSVLEGDARRPEVQILRYSAARPRLPTGPNQEQYYKLTAKIAMLGLQYPECRELALEHLEADLPLTEKQREARDAAEREDDAAEREHFARREQTI